MLILLREAPTEEKVNLFSLGVNRPQCCWHTNNPKICSSIHIAQKVNGAVYTKERDCRRVSTSV